MCIQLQYIVVETFSSGSIRVVESIKAYVDLLLADYQWQIKINIPKNTAGG